MKRRWCITLLITICLFVSSTGRVSANGVQPSLYNNPQATRFLGTVYNTQTSIYGKFSQPQAVMPPPGRHGRWVRQFPVRDQSNSIDLNYNVCRPVNFGMASRKRNNPFEPVSNGSWVSSGTDVMESKKQKYHLEPADNKSLIASGTLMDIVTKRHASFEMPPLKQCSSRDTSGLNGPDGKEEPSQLRSNASSGTLMDVYDSFSRFSASRKDAMPLGPKVDKLPLPPELRCEDKIICGFNSALDDYESILKSMKSVESSVVDPEKTSTQITSFDDNGLEVEAMNIKQPGASSADCYEDNRSWLGSTNSKKQSAALADTFTATQIKEHLSSFNQHKEDTSGNATPFESQNQCQLCSKNKLLLAPTPVYCSSCDLRIKQNVKYYRSTDENNNTQHSICAGCFSGSRGSTVITSARSVSKDTLHMAKNDEEIEDSWVECDKCQCWQHRICGLYNNETDLEGKAEYIYPKCCLKEIENGTRISLPETVMGAKHLPRTNLSDHIEQRLLTQMKEEREETAKFLGIASEKVPVAEGLVVRVVVSVDKKLEVKKQFRDIFHGQDYPEQIEYKSKLILLFQKIGGVDVCLLGMYVQAFGSECSGPNNRCVSHTLIQSSTFNLKEKLEVENLFGPSFTMKY